MQLYVRQTFCFLFCNDCLALLIILSAMEYQKITVIILQTVKLETFSFFSNGTKIY